MEKVISMNSIKADLIKYIKDGKSPDYIKNIQREVAGRMFAMISQVLGNMELACRRGEDVGSGKY